MTLSPRGLNEELLARDAEYQRLWNEHRRRSAQLEELIRSEYINSENLLLETNLKKMKRRLKDEMQWRIALFSRRLQTH